jgi:hypothetical protein
VVEDSRLRGARGRAVVVAGDGVQELGQHGRVEVAGALLDQPQPEMDVAEQAPLLGRPERGAWPQLADAADVVQERCGEHEVEPEPGMELRGLATERRDADGVLEEAAGVAVMAVGAGRRERAERPANLGIAEE